MQNPLDLPTPPPERAEPEIPRLSDLTGRVLGDFQLVRRLGQGGMGQVYLARQLSLNRQVAVKILRTDLAANEASLQRFQQEAQSVARITHANIVQVYTTGEADGLHYMALEYVEGRNLRDYINRKGPPELSVAVNIMRQVAAALQRASELGFVHRDIKPENILLTRKGEVKVADFGLSRCFASEQPLNLTQSGVTMGTPLYMSPEQVQGRPVDPRSDIYSFGVTCYHMLAGEPPFGGQSPFEVAVQHVQNEPRALSEVRPDLPAGLCAVVHKMMAKKPEERYQTAREILRDLALLKDDLSATFAQKLLAHGGATTSSIGAAGLAPAPAAPTQPVAAAASRWGRWLLGAFLLLAAGSAGAALQWKMSAPENKASDHETDAKGGFSNPARAAEREQLRRLSERDIRSDAEPTNAVLELALIHVREALTSGRDARFDEAEQLFDLDHLRRRPALLEAQSKSGLGQQYLAVMNALGKGIVLAYRDRPNESIAELRKVMPVPPKPKPGSRPPVDSFLARYDRWKKAVADALERNARNLNAAKLDDHVNRYRSYSKSP